MRRIARFPSRGRKSPEPSWSNDIRPTPGAYAPGSDCGSIRSRTQLRLLESTKMTRAAWRDEKRGWSRLGGFAAAEDTRPVENRAAVAAAKAWGGKLTFDADGHLTGIDLIDVARTNAD